MVCVVGENNQLAFSNLKYMEAPSCIPTTSSAAENAANKRKLDDDKATIRSKYLDECGPYTDDGYMQQKHIYADVGDVVPPPSIVPSHYDVPDPKPSSTSPTSSDTNNIYLYDEPRQALPVERSLSYSNIPTGDHYDIPKKSREVAVEYAEGTEAMGASSPDMQSADVESLERDSPSAEAAHYDTPKYKLKSLEKIDAEVSV